MKPSIFKPDISSNINNNKKTYYSYLEAYDKSNDKKTTSKREEMPIDTLNRLIGSGSYIFNKKVAIVTNDRTYNTKIAGKIGNRIITIDGDDILLDNIKKIIEK